MTNETLIDISSPDTWPPSVSAAVQEADRRTAIASHTNDLRIAPDDTAAVWAALEDASVHARHFTRLLPHELHSIRNGGLRLHSRELFNQRIDEAMAHGYIEPMTASRLKSVSIPAAESKQRGDRDFVCLTVGPVIEEDPAAVAQLIGNWGGEGIYFAEGSKPYEQLLQSLGKPAVVHIALSLKDRSTLQFHPPLEKLLLGRDRGLGNLHGEILSRAAIRPGAIVDIEVLEDPSVSVQ